MSVYPNQAFTKDNVKVRWEERYTSEALNKKFLGVPRGVYAGFRPQIASNLLLNLITEPGEGYSLARVQAGSEVMMLDIVTESTVTLDFTGHSEWPIYVVAQADYQVGLETTGSIVTQQNPATTPQQVTICKVDRPGNAGSIIVSPDALHIFPTNDIVSREEPYAFDDRISLVISSLVGIPQLGDIITVGAVTARVVRINGGFTGVDIALVTNGPIGVGPATFAPSGAIAVVSSVGATSSTGQRFGFMPKGSKEALDVAYVTSQEVVAARTDITGVTAPIFNPATPQTTGLPARLTQDLRTNALSGRLGLKLINTRSNTYNIPGPLVDINMTVVGSFSVGDRIQVTANPSIFGYIRGIVGPVYTVQTFSWPLGQFVAPVVAVPGDITNVSAVGTGTMQSVITKSLNISGSFSAARRGVLNNPPVTDLSITSILSSTSIPVIGPSGTEDLIPGAGSDHPAVTGAITQTSINTVMLTVTAIKNFGGSFNSVDAFLAGEVITGGTSGAKASVSELRFPYLVASAISGVSSSFTVGETVTGAISGATAKVTAASVVLMSDSERNICFIKRTDTGERYTLQDTTTGLTNVIYGRLEFTLQDRITTSTLSFQNGSSNVNTSADLRTVLDLGDLVQAPDGRFYEVTSVSATLITIHQSYLGPALAPPTANVLRRRLTINLKIRPVNTGIEGIPVLPTTMTTVPVQVFFPVWLTEASSDYDAALLMLGTGEPTLPDATTTVKGKTLLAPNNSTGGLNTANDTKAGMVVNVQQLGVNIGLGNYHTINFATSVAGAVTPGAPGIINVAATGPQGPPGAAGSNGTNGDTGAGFTVMEPFKLGSPIIGPVSGATSIVFTTVPSPKMVYIGIALIHDRGDFDGADTISITGATVVGNTVTITFALTFDVNVTFMGGAAG